MRYLFLLALLLFSFGALSQVTYQGAATDVIVHRGYSVNDSGASIPYNDTAKIKGSKKIKGLTIIHTNNVQYTYNGSYWVNTSGAGGGTVTSVSGTTNRVTSTGGTTPVIDISATFEATLGRVANPLSQFAATTSAQLYGILSDETGTGGVAVFSLSPILTTPNLGTPSAVVLTNATGLPEGGLNLTDVTTANASTSKHGLLKKLDNTATHYMDGTGAWSSPSMTIYAGSTATGAGYSGGVMFDAGSVVSQSAAFLYDIATDKLTVGLSTTATAVTQAVNNNSTKPATTAYVDYYHPADTTISAAYTLTSRDLYRTIHCTNGSNIALTIPTGLGLTFQCMVIHEGAGTVTPTASGTTFTFIPTATTKTNGGAIWIKSTATANTFLIQGSLQ